MRLSGDDFTSFYSADGRKITSEPHLELKGDSAYYGEHILIWVENLKKGKIVFGLQMLSNYYISTAILAETATDRLILQTEIIEFISI